MTPTIRQQYQYQLRADVSPRLLTNRLSRAIFIDRTFYQYKLWGDSLAPRMYRQVKRSAAAEDTRSRIVEATIALHAEKGIVATSMKDIAARADVGIGTVYHHFPTYEDIVRACGPRIQEITHAPTPEIFAGVEGLDRRIERLVS